MLRVLLGREPGDALLPALPFSLIACNRAARAVALLGVRFDMESPQGKPYSVVHYADTLRHPEKADLTPGAMRFVCAEQLYTNMVLRGEAAVDPRGPMSLENLRKARRMRASIDCVAFADGEFSGPDTNGAFERMARERAAESALVSAVLKSNTPEAAVAEAVNEPASRTLGRKLMEGFLAGGAPLVQALAGQHRCRIELKRL